MTGESYKKAFRVMKPFCQICKKQFSKLNYVLKISLLINYTSIKNIRHNPRITGEKRTNDKLKLMRKKKRKKINEKN